MDEFSKLPNIGKEVEQQLYDADIRTIDQLRALGSKRAWLKIQENDSSACIHRLLALEGAIRGIKKIDLPAEVKQELKAFYQEHKQ